MSMERFDTAQLDYCCSFCGKDHSNHGVRVVAGPTVYICEECIQVCHEILEAWPRVVGKELEGDEQQEEEVVDTKVGREREEDSVPR